MNKILTIIIPVYNTENYILRCLNSLIHPNINAIIVDDGSTDKSPKIIDDFCKMHHNFKVIHTSNQGAAKARTTGLKYVQTKYFSFVDSDDIVNINAYLNMCYEMDKQDFKVGNGRMTVYLPNWHIPFHSRKWGKKYLDFSKDKIEFSNLTCSLLDKIWHIDCASLFMFESNQTVYEDMEIVYYAIAKNRYMLHSNDLIYNYCMRSLEQNSTSALGLQMTKSSTIDGVSSAAISMIDKFKKDNLYSDYIEELNAIIIKLFYQRIFNILNNKKIVNKKEMAELVFQILNSLVPNWTNNKYLQMKFRESEYNDYLFYIGTNILKRFYNVVLSNENSDYESLIEAYDKKIILKKDQKFSKN